MLKERKKQRKATFIFAAALVSIVLAVVVFSVISLGGISRSMEKETEKYVGEISRTAYSTVDSRVRRNLAELSTTAFTLGLFEDIRGEEARACLENGKVYGYERLVLYKQDVPVIEVVTDAADETTEGRGRGSVDWVNTPCYERAKSGLPSLKIVGYSPEAGTGSLVYAVPFFSDPTVENASPDGVLMAFGNKAQMRRFLAVDIFHDVGFVHITDAEGNFLMLSENRENIYDADNIVDFFNGHARLEKGVTIEQIAESMQTGSPVNFYFSLEDGVRKIAHCAPLVIENASWYLFCVVPTSVTADSMQLLFNQTIWLTATTVALFALFALLLFYVYSRGRHKLEKLAYVDAVTGGMSGARFDMLALETIRSNRPDRFVMVSMDVDKFKLINDLYGSRMGDRSLAHILTCLCEHLEPGELAARTSADKFNLLLRFDCRIRLTERIEAMIRRINSFNEERTVKYYLSFSVGAYIIDDPSLDLITIQDRANAARKAHGAFLDKLNESIFFAERERQLLASEKDIENRMRTALENHEFTVYLQPKYELSENRIVGAEALVRWKDPERGVIPPGEFIPIFEKNGFITELDLYVFEEVCGLLERWNRAGHRMAVSVNVSRVHLSNPDFLTLYRRAFEKYEVPAGEIELELTETLIFENMERLIDVVNRLHEIGFKCSLDDFGSGYSSLNILKDIPVDIIKLDRVFFCDSGRDGRAENIIESIVLLAKKLNMLTVSEGVESGDQLKFLRRIRCDMVQGFVFSKPLPIEEFETLAFGRTSGVSDEK